MKLLILKCKNCDDSFEYLKKYSYTRSLCNKCVKDKNIKAIKYIQNKKLHIKYGRSNGNYKGKILKNCRVCKKEFYVIPYFKAVEKSCSRKCNNEWKSMKYSAEGNPNYVDGRSWEPYKPEFNFALKEKVRERDNRICQECGISEHENVEIFNQKLSVHHVNYVKGDCSEYNLVSLCTPCHNKIPTGNTIYQTKYENILKEAYVA